MSYLRVNQVNLSNTNSVRFNDTEKRFEVFSGNFWIPLAVDTALTAVTGKTKQVFTNTGANQTWTVPAGVTYIFAKMWGAGGGPGRVSGWSYGSPGGAGGFSHGIIPVAAGESLVIIVGSGGIGIPGPVTSFGGGGGNANTSDQSYSGQGGGLSGIFRGSFAQASALMIAGGGGGGGSSRTWIGNGGGAGGGLVGQRGGSPYDGKFLAGGDGGTQSAGGSAGTGWAGNGTAGAGMVGGVSGTNSYGGGGGGGYYGGAGGSYSESNTMAGGGGGSGFLAPTVLYGRTFVGNFQNPPMANDPDFPSSAGSATNNAPGRGADYQGNGTLGGGHGYVVIYY
jgi:hypothetical protein